MNSAPLISICIPAYKNVDYLKRLFDSIAIQNFTNYEVIVTDDSPDDEVKNFVTSLQGINNLKYVRNPIALGTPENWNAAIRLAKGDWIKLMHDDDWFQSADSLKTFVQTISKVPSCNFVFSAYTNVHLSTGNKENIYANGLRRIMLRGNPATLAARNIVGPPSAVIFRRTELTFNKQLKWLVDIDFYIRALAGKRAVYIEKTLVNIGISDLQVTKTASRVREVEVPELFLLFEKIGYSSLKNMWVFDAWWRLLRNFSIRGASDIEEAGYEGDVPAIIMKIISFQRRLPAGILKFGITSKLFMSLCYLVTDKSSD